MNFMPFDLFLQHKLSSLTRYQSLSLMHCVSVCGFKSLGSWLFGAKIVLYIGIRRWRLKISNFFIPRPILMKLSANLSHIMTNCKHKKFWLTSALKWRKIEKTVFRYFNDIFCIFGAYKADLFTLLAFLMIRNKNWP